jgi:hypothetical protein
MGFWQAFESEVYVYHCAVKEERHPVYKVLGVLGYAFLPFAAFANALSGEFAEEYAPAAERIQPVTGRGRRL